MVENEVICGFRILRVRHAPEQSATLFEMEHEKTGALLCWLKREEENKTFAISFRTIPEDDTGVFHIIEHSVLNGSDKYPTKEPFVELLKSSMQTFLNALTYPDKTVYPVSSRNPKDFENLVSVYLDAVFHPMFRHRREAFDQEGWHFVPEDDGTFTRNGVVLSEMKGAFSSVDEVIMAETFRRLCPDTSYRFVSGGDPEHICELTYEKFLETYEKFYHPSNARIFLDGDIDIERILGLIGDGCLSSFEKRECPFEIEYQGSVPPSEATVSYPAASEDDSVILSKAYITGKYTEKNKQYALSLIADYLTGDNDAPVTKAMLEGDLVKSTEAFISSEMAEPTLFFVLRGIEKKNKEKIEKVLTNVLGELADGGIDREKMASLIDNAQFRTREGNFSWTPSGVSIALSVLDAWNYGEDPLISLENDAAFEFLRRGLENGYFEKLIREVILENTSNTTLLAVPDEEYEMKAEEREAAVTASLTDKMDDAEKEDIISRYEKLRVRQEEPDSREALASIPVLSLSDVSPEVKRVRVSASDGILTNDIRTRGINYVHMYFAAGGLTREEVSAISAAAALLGTLPTEKYSSDEVTKKLTGDLGRFSCSLASYQSDEDANLCKVYFNVNFSCLFEKNEKALALVPEILLNTDFSDKKRIKDTFLKMIEGMRQAFISDGHRLAVMCADAALTASGAVADLAEGLSYYRYIRRLKDEIEKGTFDHTVFEKVLAKVMRAGSLLVSLTGSDDTEFAEKLRGCFPDGDGGSPVMSLAPDMSCPLAIEIPSSVSYAGAAGQVRTAGALGVGMWKVLAQLASLDYLWNEIRVKGGAYGTNFLVSDGGNVFFNTYRDPAPAASFEKLRELPAYISALDDDEDIDGIILGTLAQSDPYLSPEAMARRCDILYLKGKTFDDIENKRRCVMNTTVSDLKALVPELKGFTDSAKYCVVGKAADFPDYEVYFL